MGLGFDLALILDWTWIGPGLDLALTRWVQRLEHNSVPSNICDKMTSFDTSVSMASLMFSASQGDT